MGNDARGTFNFKGLTKTNDINKTGSPAEDPAQL